WQELTEQHARLAHAASLIEAAQLGVDALSEGGHSSLARVNAVIGKVNGPLGFDHRVRGGLEGLEAGQVKLQGGVHNLRRYGDRIELDPQRLREVESRLDAIHSAARKYRTTAEELPERLGAARARLDELGSGTDVDTLRKLEEEAHTECVAEAKTL